MVLSLTLIEINQLVKANGSKKIGEGWATTCKMISDGPDG